MKNIVRLFHFCINGWLIGYLLAMLALGNEAWLSGPVSAFKQESPLHALDVVVQVLGPIACTMLSVALVLLAVWMMKEPRWWLGLLIWFLFRIITHRMWLASNGGIQLMENLLFWSPFIHLSASGKPLLVAVGRSAFWIGRLQLLLAYAAAAAHKFTGTTWLDGSAMTLVASDPGFHLEWLLEWPSACVVLTYSTLAFMALFPLAVWWGPARRVWLSFGALFHLSTAVFMGIPQMGFAFIAGYSLWLSEEEATAILLRMKRMWMRAMPRRAQVA
ncbi:MAG: hypothetical protein ABI599_16600 [Flavobacteriales bacterium]